MRHEDARDDFVFRRGDAEAEPASQGTGRETVDVIFPTGCPAAEATPLFSLERYFAELDESRRSVSGSIRTVKSEEGEQRPDVGDILFYCEAVGSTQTMLQE